MAQSITVNKINTMTLSINQQRMVILSVIYAEFHTQAQLYMLSAIMLNVFMLNVVALDKKAYNIDII
jgi:hypothetical protein